MSDKLKLQNGSYSISNIQDYFEFISKNHGESTDNSSIKIYVNKIENRVTFKIKNGYSLKIVTRETMKLLETLKMK